MGKVFDVIKGADVGSLDINDYVVKHPASTFYMAMEIAGPDGSDIKAGDVLVIDRSLNPKPHDLVVVEDEGELNLAFFSKKEVVLWGKVTGFIRRY